MALTVGTGVNRGVSVPTTSYRTPAQRTAPTYRPPARKSYTAPRPTYRAPSSSGSQYRASSGGQRGGVGMRGVSSTPGGASAGAIPTLAKYLAGDTAYQQALRGGQRTLADFLSELGRQRTEAGASFTQSKSLMEADRVKQLENLENEYASRGLLSSGLYGEAQGDFQEQFQNQLNALQQAQTSLLADLLSQETNFRREQELAQEVARQEALRRRAERYGVT